MTNRLRIRLGRRIDAFKTDSLFRNAVFLMSSTAIMSVLGFGFWLFVAHLYTPEAIGAASALIAITILIANLSFLGLDSGILRFLPQSKTPSRDINAAMIVVGAATMVGAAVYLGIMGSRLSDSLGVFSSGPAGAIAFILLMIVISLNTFTDGVFIANRRAGLHTVIYTIYGIVKLITPLFLVSLNSLGVFSAYIMASIAALTISFVFMTRYCGYHFWSRPNWQFITQSRRYAYNNYFGMLFSGLPSQIMPSLVISRLGEKHAAYYSMAWTMVSLLYVIPTAMGNSLIAESSHDSTRHTRNVKRVVRTLVFGLVPVVAIAVLAAPYLLRLFGGQYSAGGSFVFQLLAVSTFFFAANTISNTLMNIDRRSGGVVITQGVIAAVTIITAWPLMNLGLAGVGLAVILGGIAGNITQLILRRSHKSRPAESASAATTLEAGSVY